MAGKEWPATYLDSVADDLEYVVGKLRDISSQMKKNNIESLRLQADASFVTYRQAFLTLAGKVESQFREQLTVNRDGVTPSWKRNRRTVMQRAAKKTAVSMVESLGLMDASSAKAITLRQLAGLLHLHQAKAPRDDVAELLQEIRESGVDYEKDAAINDAKSKLQSQGLIKPPVEEGGAAGATKKKAAKKMPPKKKST